MTDFSLDALQEACTRVAAATEFDEALAMTLRYAVSLTGSEWGVLVLYNRTSGQWFVHSKAGEAEPGDRTLKAASTGEAIEDAVGLALPLKAKGRVVGAVGVGRSGGVAAESRLALEIFAAAAALAIESTLTRTDFVSTVTHEMRLPMTSIKGYADLLRSGMTGPISEMQAQLLDTVRNNVDWMNALVSDLSDIAKVETGRLKVDIETVDAAECVQEAVTAARGPIEAKSQSLTVEAASGLPVRADRNRIVQMLQCLLTNANRYTAPSGQITVSARAQDGRVRLAVTDTGIGMTPADRAKLFTQFFRSEDPVVRDHKGWGLSLHLVKRLAELFGGAAGAETEHGKGSTVWFEVPSAA